MTKWIFAVAACAVGVVAGVTVGVLWRFNVALEPAALPAVAARQTTHPATSRPSIATDAQAPIGDDTLANILLLPSDFQQTLTLYTLLADTDRDALERLLDEADRLQPRHEGRAAKSIIYSRYAELDPNAAVERIIAHGRPGQNLLPQVFQAWAKYDPMAARRRAESLPPLYRRAAGAAILAISENFLPAQRDEIAATFGLRGQLEHMQAEESMGTSPQVAWQQALAAPPGRQRENTLYHVAYGWGASNPAEALAATSELRQSLLRSSLQRGLMTRWVMLDRDAAQMWLQAQPPSNERTEMTAGFVSGLAQSTPHEALDFALDLAVNERRGAADTVLRVWARQDPRSAAEALAGLGDAAIAERSASNVIHQWASVDPYAAFDWISGQDALGQDSWLTVAPLRKIAEHQPVEALDLALGLPKGRKQAVTAVLEVWAPIDPRAAAAWLQRSSAQVNLSAISAVAHWYAEEDMDDALDWLQAQPLERQERAVYSVVRAAESLAEASRIVDVLDDPEVRNQAFDSAVGYWASANPVETLAWIGRTSAPDEKVELQGRVFDIWAQTDPIEAAAHVRRLGTRAQRDAAHAALARAVVHDDPDFAERMYKRIRSKDARQAAAEHLYWASYQEDPDSAERYRDDAGISAQHDLVHESAH